MAIDTATELLMRLRTVGLGVQHDLTARLRPLHLRPGELDVLQHLVCAPGASASVLGRHLDLQRQSLRQQLLSLEQRGLIHREVATGDPRAVGYSATAAGVRALEAGLGVVRDLGLQVLSRHGRRGGEQLLALLGRTQRTLRLARQASLDTEVEEDALPERLSDLYTENGFEPFR